MEKSLIARDGLLPAAPALLGELLVVLRGVVVLDVAVPRGRHGVDGALALLEPAGGHLGCVCYRKANKVLAS